MHVRLTKKKQKHFVFMISIKSEGKEQNSKRGKEEKRKRKHTSTEHASLLTHLLSTEWPSINKKKKAIEEKAWALQDHCVDLLAIPCPCTDRQRCYIELIDFVQDEINGGPQVSVADFMYKVLSNAALETRMKHAPDRPWLGRQLPLPPYLHTLPSQGLACLPPEQREHHMATGKPSSGSGRSNVEAIILHACFALGLSTGTALRQAVMRSSMACGHSLGTRVRRRKPLRGVSCVAISPSTTPKLNMSTCSSCVGVL